VAKVPAFPMPTDQATVKCSFTAAELDRLLTLLPATLRPAVEFSWLTGLRKGNVVALTWPEINFDRREIVLAGVVMNPCEPLTVPFTRRVETILPRPGASARRCADGVRAAGHDLTEGVGEGRRPERSR